MLIAAEEFGVNAANAKDMAGVSKNPEVRRILGAEELQRRASLGLDPAWAVNVIASVGNYGEIFERHLVRAQRSGSRAVSTRNGRMAG